MGLFDKKPDNQKSKPTLKPPQVELEWETVKHTGNHFAVGIAGSRARVAGGWIYAINHGQSASCTFIPDAQGDWQREK